MSRAAMPTVSRLCRWRGRLRDAAGQSVVETCMTLGFVMALIMALVMLVLLASTRHIVNYAAFAGARASMYSASPYDNVGRGGRDQQAVEEVTSMMNWGNRPQGGVTAGGYRVSYPTPFGFPLFNAGGGHTISVSTICPIPSQPAVPETGDNASR